jgi:hypothetical protein
MATNTYVALDKVTVGTATSTVTFSSIPQGYTDLVLVANARNSSGSGVDLLIRLNSDSGSNYSRTQLFGTGSSAGSSRDSNLTYLYIGQTAPTGSGEFYPNTLQFMNYSNTTTNKTILNRVGSPNNNVTAMVSLWRSTAAITSMTLTVNTGPNFEVGSTFSLYGIAAASVGAKATGGTIYSDASYYYHVFNASGTFTPTQSITADCLVVAGGGGGGGDWGGGGGAGGYLTFTSQSLTATGYTVTVGAGGAGAPNTSSNGSVGADSQFAALTLVKGGGYGAKPFVAGGTGGSGGGGGYGGYSGGSATSGQGYAGGSSGTDSGAPGGGGAGQAGASVSNPNNTNGGKGGDGLYTAISGGAATGLGQLSGGNYYFAGGGGGRGGVSPAVGGAGGLGGGGTGATNGVGNGTAGQIATGGGGGAGNSVAGAGGSGVVIVRYAK